MNGMQCGWYWRKVLDNVLSSVGVLYYIDGFWYLSDEFAFHFITLVYYNSKEYLQCSA